MLHKLLVSQQTSKPRTLVVFTNPTDVMWFTRLQTGQMNLTRPRLRGRVTSISWRFAGRTDQTRRTSSCFTRHRRRFWL